MGAGLLAPWTPTLIGQALSGLAGGSLHRCQCLCECSQKADAEILGLLKGQLDRCGPSNLTPVCPACLECSFTPPLLTGFLLILIGFLAGALTVRLCKPGHAKRAAGAGSWSAGGRQSLLALRAPVGAVPRAVSGSALGRLTVGGGDPDA